MQDRPLQGPFAQIVVQGSAALSQKQRQRLPVPQQIRDRLPQARVRLHLPLGKLRLQPIMQLVHYRPTMLLVKTQPLLRRHIAVARLSVVPVHLSELQQDVPALDGKVLRHLNDLTSSMCEAMGHQQFHSIRQLRRIP